MAAKTWFTSDTHFHHARVIEYCRRPWRTVDEMNEGLISNWNAVVAPEDTVYFLGDFAFANAKRADALRQQLNGRVRFLRGNHDSRAAQLLFAFENSLLPGDTYTEGDVHCTLVHEPHRSVDAAVRHPIVLHGHVHELWAHNRIGDRLYLNVGVDVRNYRPVSLAELLASVLP